MTGPRPTTRIFVDADACPVKDEVVRVAERHGLAVHMVSNSWMRLPDGPLVERVVVADGPDAVRKAVRTELRSGSDFIKIMSSGGVASPSDPFDALQYTPEEVQAATVETDHRHTYTTSHAYQPEAISQAIENGVRCIEHGNLLDAPTARRMAELGVTMVPTLVTYAAMTMPVWLGRMMADESRGYYAVQFHPEVTHTRQGRAMLERFVLDICGAGPDWVMRDHIGEAVARIRDLVGSEEVILGLSGGVDSSVAAALIHRAIGDRLVLRPQRLKRLGVIFLRLLRPREAAQCHRELFLQLEPEIERTVKQLKSGQIAGPIRSVSGAPASLAPSENEIAANTSPSRMRPLRRKRSAKASTMRCTRSTSAAPPARARAISRSP